MSYLVSLVGVFSLDFILECACWIEYLYGWATGAIQSVFSGLFFKFVSKKKGKNENILYDYFLTLSVKLFFMAVFIAIAFAVMPRQKLEVYVFALFISYFIFLAADIYKLLKLRLQSE